LQEAYAKQEKGEDIWRKVSRVRGFFTNGEDLRDVQNWCTVEESGLNLRLNQEWPLRRRSDRDKLVPIISGAAARQRILVPNRTAHKASWRELCEQGKLLKQHAQQLAACMIGQHDEVPLPARIWTTGLTRFCRMYVCGGMQLEELMGGTCDVCNKYFTMLDNPHNIRDCVNQVMADTQNVRGAARKIQKI
jgi:hypothetical protein